MTSVVAQMRHTRRVRRLGNLEWFDKLVADVGLADRLSRHLVRRSDLPIAWDEPLAGIIDDRCLVFVKRST